MSQELFYPFCTLSAHQAWQSVGVSECEEKDWNRVEGCGKAWEEGFPKGHSGSLKNPYSGGRDGFPPHPPHPQ